MSTTFSGWLLGRSEEGLAEVLRLRADARSQPAPTTPVALADRLSTRHSILLALATVDRPSLKVAEAVLAHGGPATMDDIGQLVAVGEDGPAAVRRCLDELTRRAIVIDGTNAHGARQWRAVGALHQVIPQPLGLGGSLARLLGDTDPRVLGAMAATLGVTVGSTPAATRKSLVAALTPDRIRQCAAQAPDLVRRYLDVALRQSPVLETSEASALYYPGLLRPGDNPAVWAALHGLLLPAGWGQVEMPREVALALRGGARPAVTLAAEPVVPTVVVGATDVLRESRAAASALVELVTALGDFIARSPVAALKSSGVGVREVRRLAKVHAADEAKVGFALQLAGTAGLLSASGAETVPLHAYEGWRASSPPEQLAVLVRAWWTTDDAITERFDHNGKPLAPLAFGAQRPDARVMRSELVRILHGLPRGAGAVGADPAVDRLLWSRPLAYLPGAQGVAAGRAAWFEAEQLGVVARGSLTDLGRALLEESVDKAVTRAAAELMPAAVGTATLQADLTALVAGTPTAGLAAILDGLAERESRGHATMWRFSPASIRRAMDAGETADAILDALRSISAKTLPQPLDYLVRDVARRHGHLQVAPVGCCVLADDPALLQEIASTRSLASLKPRVLAPTVLAVTGTVANALEVLRAAGFAPVQLSATGEVVVTKVASRTMTPPASAIPDWSRYLERPNRRAAPPADPTELAQAILRGPAKGAQPRASGSKPSGPSKTITPSNVVSLFDRGVAESTASTDGILEAHAPHLTDGERALLAFAIVEDAEVHIEYRDANGKRTERVISEIELTPPFLEAWCHLREDDRMFSLAGILSVAPA